MENNSQNQHQQIVQLPSHSMNVQSENKSTQNLQSNQSNYSVNHSNLKQSYISPLTRHLNKFKLNQDNLTAHMCNMQQYFKNKQLQRYLDQRYNLHSIISKQDEDRIKFTTIFDQMKLNKNYKKDKLGLTLRESRGIAAVLGMAIGDALGSCTQFHHFSKSGLQIVKNGFKDLQKQFSRSGKTSVWTDDASMGLCMADCILLNDYEFNPKHMRYLFTLWLQHGLNNGGRNYSIGLGGNISISMYQFARKQEDYTERGDRFNNGNGSLMRLAPVPVAYSNNLKQGIQNSGKQSLTTHNGAQAEECSKLMANILIQLINRGQNEDGKQIILKVCNEFKSDIKSVEFLARGKQENLQFYEEQCKNQKFRMFNKRIEDRNWNWRDESFTYAPTRLSQQPGYIGSYCMDALSMALHTVLFTSSFKEVVIKNADMGGDCDTVGSIAGQIAGALYGIDDEMLTLYSEMEDFQNRRYEVFLKGYKLINRKKI